MSIHDEFDFIKKIQPSMLHSKDVVGIGDDAAIVGVNPNFEQVICVDTMVEDVHFLSHTMAPYDIGFKALASNISDLAAMGAIPKYYLVSISIPVHWKESDLIDIYKGMQHIGNEFFMDLIGGDTTATNSKLVLSVTVIGHIEKGKRLLRSNARPKDIIFVSGTVGDSAGGLQILLNRENNKEKEYLIRRHQQPSPRVKLGRILSKYSRVALNDVSDGLASELKEIATASKANMIIDKKHIPISNELLSYSNTQAITLALTGGEDFELVGTISIDEWDKLKSECNAENIEICKIGTVELGDGKVFIKEDNEIQEIANSGYNHFNNG